MIQRLASLSILSLCLLCVTSQGDETITRGNNLSVDVAADGRLIIDLAGDIWAIPAAGGDATRITDGLGSARRPRWSPDGLRVVYTVNAMQEQGLWVHDTSNQETLSISENSHFDLDPTWHPDGQRVTYASDRTGKGFDLWEVDLPTGLHWRQSSRPGD